MRAQIAIAAAAVVAAVLTGTAQQPQTPPGAATSLVQRIVHTRPAGFRASKGVHGGAGQLDFAALLSANAFDTNMHFVHRGVIQPKGGIGARTFTISAKRCSSSSMAKHSSPSTAGRRC